jgi:hypothetical protein
MRKFILAVLFCILMVNIQASVKGKQNDEIRGYWWILHNDGCYYLYRIEVGEEDGRTVAWFYPMNHLNYSGTYARCTYAETIESMC